MAKQNSIFGKYNYHVKIGFFFSLLALLLIFPLIVDFEMVGFDLVWTGFISGPVVFGVLAGFLLDKKIKNPSKSDVLATALAFSFIYIIGLFISFDEMFIGGDNWLGTIIMVYFFSAFGILIGRYSSKLFQ